jgi:murein DD-endopeptidase MepM/ murein hydrolase activator NlpD
MRDRTVIGVLAFLALMRGRGASVPWGGGWYWPVPSVRYPDGRTYSPIITDGLGSPRGSGTHWGVDIMFRGYRTGDDLTEPPPYFAPVGTPITAARAGHVWSVAKSPRGWSVVIDHGKPFATFYQHLASVSALAKGMTVSAGQRIGTMGIDPLDAQKVRHLHFAVWFDGMGDAASVDPAPVIGNWLRPSTWSVTT